MNILKGFIIGIGKIIPGVSGSLIALNLGLYEKILDSINNFFKDFKNNTLFLFKIGIGILLAIILGSKVIIYCLNKNYGITMTVFIGLLIGSNNGFDKTNKKITFLTFLLMSLLVFIKNDCTFIYKDTFLNDIYVIILGFIDAATMIIPAISGTAIFILLGSYNFILSLFSNPFLNIKITILFFIGLMLGIIIVSRIMSNLLKTKANIILPIINGFFLSSLLFLFIQVFNKSNFFELVLSIPILFISILIGNLCNK